MSGVMNPGPPSGRELEIATTNGAALIAQVAVALDGCGVPVRSLTLRTPTLDDVFLHVTGSHFAADAPSTGTTTGTTTQEADS